MIRCVVKGCGQFRSLILGEGYETDLCTYHSKIRRGLMLPSVEGIRWKLGLRSLRPIRVVIGPIRAGSVLTDEMIELSVLLRGLGYPSNLVKRLMTREVR